jgi:predicted nucleotidyltransferase
MIKIIQKELEEIEKRENIKILYACESGSRTWGFPSKDSDYDVRFIYIRPSDWYLSIDDQKDTLEFPINDVLDVCWRTRVACANYLDSARNF